MKSSWIYIKIVLLIVLIGFLFGFSNKRNESRKLSKIEVEFVDDNNPFITVDAVNKLLIQNQVTVTGIGKETLVLNELEHRLINNPMVRNAQVFVSVDGRLGAKIEQRKPLGRVSGSPDWYLDADGKRMPLSQIYTARVPLITGVSRNNFEEVAPLLIKINEDEFMKTSVVGIHEHFNGTITLRLRKQDFNLFLGKPVAIEKKFQNYKAFYKKNQQDTILKQYSRVNLQFESQVVATKKV